jgi:hypothetical protein
MKRTVVKVLCTYVVNYSLFKSGCLSTNIELTLYKALIGLVTNMAYASSTWECAADAHF